jgi:hypothetical protein
VLPTYVALVPLEQNSNIPLDHLREVAAALQTQVVRDLGPVWGVAGTVSAFAQIEDIHQGYVPLALTKADLPLDRHGFHFVMGGLPFAVVQYQDDGTWTLAASHELLEMLCDPFAQRAVLAPSLADTKDDAITAAGTTGTNSVIVGEDPGSYARQGLVNYLVEVCDPCEESTYEINGVTVSDFVTPGYYDTRGTSPAPYSFRGRVNSQLGVLDGGSISWRPLLPQSLVYQASAGSPYASKASTATPGSAVLNEVPAENLQIQKVVDGTSGLSIGSQRSPNRPAALAPARTYHTTHTSWNAASASIRDDLNALLEYLAFISTNQPPTIDEVIALLQNLLKQGGAWSTFESNPTFRQSELKKLGLNVSGVNLHKRLDRTEYEKVLSYLQEQKTVAGIFGPDLAGNEAALWLCMQIG